VPCPALAVPWPLTFAPGQAGKQASKFEGFEAVYRLLFFLPATTQQPSFVPGNQWLLHHVRMYVHMMKEKARSSQRVPLLPCALRNVGGGAERHLEID
jgi:hypothetical protein